jgi:hypothetical protein
MGLPTHPNMYVHSLQLYARACSPELRPESEFGTALAPLAGHTRETQHVIDLHDQYERFRHSRDRD